MIGLILLIAFMVAMAWALNTPSIHKRLLRWYARIWTSEENRPYPLTPTTLQDISEHKEILIRRWNEASEQARLCLFALQKSRTETGEMRRAAEQLYAQALKDMEDRLAQVRRALNVLQGYDPVDIDLKGISRGLDLINKVLDECKAGQRSFDDGLQRIAGFLNAVILR